MSHPYDKKRRTIHPCSAGIPASPPARLSKEHSAHPDLPGYAPAISLPFASDSGCQSGRPHRRHVRDTQNGSSIQGQKRSYCILAGQKYSKNTALAQFHFLLSIFRRRYDKSKDFEWLLGISTRSVTGKRIPGKNLEH